MIDGYSKTGFKVWIKRFKQFKKFKFIIFELFVIELFSLLK